MRPAAPRPPRAAGFSLLEILLATSILVGSLAVLSELAALGRHHAEDAQERTAAQTLCETHVNEILAGIQPAEPVEEQPIEGHPGWSYRVAIEPLPQLGLLRLAVTVQTAAKGRRQGEFTLVHWLRDPAAQRRAEFQPPSRSTGPTLPDGGRP